MEVVWGLQELVACCSAGFSPRVSSYLAPSDSCGSQEQDVPLDLGRAGLTASAGGEKMDPGQKQHGWLPLMERESWGCFFFF